MFTKKHIGRTVYDSIRYGEGTIVKFDEEDPNYPVEVEFKSNRTSFYMEDGKLDEKDLLPTLSFTPYTLEGYTNIAPRTLPDKGESILVSNNNEDWFVKTYHNVMKDGRVITTDKAHWEYYKRFKEIE